ncbi:THUMP domain-containing protein 3 [Podila humilis]|nr:THUMP domain-containing protein 3 [Podila humilis]
MQPISSVMQLTLSVPMGLEDTAVTLLPEALVGMADEVTYVLGTGYLSLVLPLASREGKNNMKEILSDLVHRPALCLFAASLVIGEIVVPRPIFDNPKDLLDYLKHGFHPVVDHDQPALDLDWQMALSVIDAFPATVSLPGLTSPAIHTGNKTMNSEKSSGCTRFRASFDRGTVQHKGVRSQDVAAALGELTGKMFPEWKVDLKEYEVEVIGRWLPQAQLVYHKRRSSSTATMATAMTTPKSRHQVEEQGISESVKRQKTGPDSSISCESSIRGDQERADAMVIQVGVALPLALSSCPYRYRPVDGRTSLKIEIAYTLLAMAGPRSGDIVLDLCAGVGTIPIVGATHFPASFFAGSDVVPSNVDKAMENAKGMRAKVDEVEGQTAILKKPSHSQPSLFLGDAKAVCWRSGSVDLIVSDLPWGQRESSHVSNCKLYPKLIKQIIRLLRVGGRAVLVTGERKLLQRQLDSVFAKPYLQLVKKREITIGFSVVVFELRRI